MIEYTGNLFDSESAYLGHGVNCQGMMGAGIAKQFRDLFPVNYRVYKRACSDGSLKPGKALVIPVKDWDYNLRLIVNFASQNQPGPDATYEWLLSSLTSFAKRASEPDRMTRFGGIIAIPEIGCGIGGLVWDDAVTLVAAVELAYPQIEFEVWHYAG